MGLVVVKSNTPFDFYVNELMVHKNVHDKKYTVCRVFPKQNQIALSLQRTKPQKPIIVNVGSDIDGDPWDEYERKPNDFDGSDLYRSETPEKCREALAKYEMIRPIVESDDIELYIKGDLGFYLQTYAKNANITIQSLYKYLNQFLAFGSHPLALLPMTFRCGTMRVLPANAKMAEQMRIARGGTYIGAKGFSDDFQRRAFTQEDKVRMQKFIKKVLPTAQDHKLSSLHELFLLTQCKTTTTVFGKEEEFTDPQKQISINQFTDHFYDNVDFVKWETYKKSQKHVQNNEEITVGKAAEYSLGPSHTFEIDATRLNVYVVSRVPEKNKDGQTVLKVIGRPYLYFIVDTFSGCIVGFLLTFQAGSSAVKKALYNAFTNKVEFCAKYGIQIEEEDWPCEHICTRLLCDRAGEYTGKLFDNILAADLKLETITYATAYISKRKGSVEANLNAADEIVFQQLDGAVKPNSAKDARHPSNFAKYNITELNQMVIEAILSFNKRRINYTRLQTLDVFEGVKPTPNILWQRHIFRRMGGGVRKPKELVKYALLDKELSVVKKDGIHLLSSKLVYRTQHKAFRDWQQQCVVRKIEPQIQVRVNHDDPRYMWFRDKQFNNEIIEFSLASSYERYEELIQHEAEQLRHEERVTKSVGRKHRTNDNVERRRNAQNRQLLHGFEGNGLPTDRKGIVSGINENFKEAQHLEVAEDTIDARRTFSTFPDEGHFVYLSSHKRGGHGDDK
ncbi:integrase catalytic domain-containing protein [Alteromonas genovensis]|uniref:integrase catalytic domain-containing protein n=1 Tax=Alteromonas genovensis TaxID=471225 RepID=UPI002FE0F274